MRLLPITATVHCFGANLRQSPSHPGDFAHPIGARAAAMMVDARPNNCASLVLKQAGVDHDFIRLADIGIHGNGHFLMQEKNNLEVVAVIANWLDPKGL
jgi:hypothetical protein